MSGSIPSGVDGLCRLSIRPSGGSAPSIMQPAHFPESAPVGLQPGQPQQPQQGQSGLQQPQQVAQKRKGAAHAEVSQTVYCCAASSTSGSVKSR